MRTLAEAKSIYHEFRRSFDIDSALRKRFDEFEGRKWFRFGKSWRRKSPFGNVYLNDDDNDLKFVFTALVTDNRNMYGATVE